MKNKTNGVANTTTSNKRKVLLGTLLPIAALAITAAVVAPTVIACKGKTPAKEVTLDTTDCPADLNVDKNLNLDTESTITVTLPKGEEIDYNNFEIKVGGKTLINGEDYEINIESNNKIVFVIKASAMKNTNVELHVKYVAKLAMLDEDTEKLGVEITNIYTSGVTGEDMEIECHIPGEGIELAKYQITLGDTVLNEGSKTLETKTYFKDGELYVAFKVYGEAVTAFPAVVHIETKPIEPKVIDIELSEYKIELKTGQSADIFASLVYNVDEDIVWTVDKEGIIDLSAKTSKSGKEIQITGKNVGQVTLTATCGEVSKSCTVTVSSSYKNVILTPYQQFFNDMEISLAKYNEVTITNDPEGTQTASWKFKPYLSTEKKFDFAFVDSEGGGFTKTIKLDSGAKTFDITFDESEWAQISENDKLTIYPTSYYDKECEIVAAQDFADKFDNITLPEGTIVESDNDIEIIISAEPKEELKGEIYIAPSSNPTNKLVTTGIKDFAPALWGGETLLFSKSCWEGVKYDDKLEVHFEKAPEVVWEGQWEIDTENPLGMEVSSFNLQAGDKLVIEGYVKDGVSSGKVGISTVVGDLLEGWSEVEVYNESFPLAPVMTKEFLDQVKAISSAYSIEDTIQIIGNNIIVTKVTIERA